MCRGVTVVSIFVGSYQLAVSQLHTRAGCMSSVLKWALRVRVYFHLKEAEGHQGTDPHQGSHS